MEIRRLYLTSLFVAVLVPSLSWADDSNTTATNNTSTAITTTVFDNDKVESGHQYRIPSLVRVDDHTLIAFTDFRGSQGSDVGGTDGHTSIIAKKSVDNGKTWEGPVTILDATKETDPNFKYSDASTVYDPESKKILLMCPGGTVAYKNGKVKVYTALVDPANLQAVTPTDITEKIYGLFPSTTGINSLFPTSGDMCMSKIIKKGNVNRIYCGLVTPKGVRVIYTDNIPQQDLSTIEWKVLGDPALDFMYHANSSVSDESKCAELPDGSVWVTSRYAADGRSRGFNVFQYADGEYSTGSWGPVNQYNSEATPNSSNGNFRMSSSRTNGGIVLIPAKRKSDGAHLYVVCHSIPYGIQNGSKYSGRRVLGINWKVLRDRNDFTTMDGVDVKYQNNDVNGSHKLLSGWNNYKIDGNQDYAAYSTLLNNGKDGVDLLYEYNATLDSPYSMVYKSIPLETITGGLYTYDGDLKREAYMNVNVKPEPGNVYLIKARFTYPDGTIKEAYLHSSFSVSTKGNVTGQDNADVVATILDAAQPFNPNPTYFWVYSQDENTSGTVESPYLSSFNGDGYLGWGEGGVNYYKNDKDLKANKVMCSPFYANSFPITGFTHKAKNYASTTSVTAEDMDGYAMDFIHSSFKNTHRFLAINEEGKAANWFQNTLRYLKNDAGHWTSDLIFTKVVGDKESGYGTFNAPTFDEVGFPITFARSENDCFEYQNTSEENRKNFDWNYYASLRAPFALYVPDGVTVYKCSETQTVTDNAEVTLTKYTDLPTDDNGKKIIPRETPVFMMAPGIRDESPTSKVYNFTIAPGKPFDKKTDTDGNNYTTHLSGTLGREVLSKDFYKGMYEGTGTYLYYVLGKVNDYVALYKLKKNDDGEFAIAKNKAYFKYNLKRNTSTAKASLSFVFEDTPNGINEVNASSANNGRVYTIDGRYVGMSLDNLAPGLYIQNGRKVVKQ